MTTDLRPIAALYVDVKRGPYAAMPGVDPWGIDRDAKRYGQWGEMDPVVAHPPCGPWGKMAHLCTKQDREAAKVAAVQVLAYGGVLEHPAYSKLWDEMDLPKPSEPSRYYFGREVYTVEVDQCDYGHPCQKRTWILCVGVPRSAWPAPPPKGTPTHVIDTSSRSKKTGENRGAGKYLPKSKRHLTPQPFADLLVHLARSVEPHRPTLAGYALLVALL